MEFFIRSAAAQDGAGGSTELLLNLFPLILLFVVFYFLLIRPQQKRMKEHQQMVNSLAKGDEVVTNGGLLGKITEVGDNFIAIEVSDNMEVKIQKQAVASVMPKGTMKTL